MNDAFLEHWTKDEVDVAGRVLRIRTHPQHAPWREAAAPFWSGSLETARPFRSSRAATVYAVTLPGAPLPYVAKKLEVRRKRFDGLKHVVRASRARRALRHGEQLRARGFRVPEPVCLLEELRGGRVTGSGLVTLRVEGEPLERIFPEVRDPRLRQGMLRALAGEVARMHQAGCAHGDLRLSNVLLEDRKGEPAFWWLDHERNRYGDGLSGRWRTANLATLNLERRGIDTRDRLTFWRAYVEAAGMSPARARRMLRAIQAATERQWRKREATPGP